MRVVASASWGAVVLSAGLALVGCDDPQEPSFSDTADSTTAGTLTGDTAAAGSTAAAGATAGVAETAGTTAAAAGSTDSSAAGTGATGGTTTAGTADPYASAGTTGSAGTTDSASTTESDDTTAAGSGATFAEVYTNVLQANACATCHSAALAGTSSNVVLDDMTTAYETLVADAWESGQCAGETLVVPGDCESSVLYQKVSAMATCGSAMPPGSMTALPEAQLTLLCDWITGGAQP